MSAHAGPVKPGNFVEQDVVEEKAAKVFKDLKANLKG